MQTIEKTEIDKIAQAFQDLAKSTANRKAADYLTENLSEEELKKELVNFTPDYLLSTVLTEIKGLNKYTFKKPTFEDLIKYLIKNICSKDTLRPAMNSVRNDKENRNIIATDCYLLAYLPYNTIYKHINNTADLDIPFNALKLDKYGDLENFEDGNNYPNYLAVYPEKNYDAADLFNITPYLITGLKTINKIAKKLKVKNLTVKLTASRSESLNSFVYVELNLLCRYIELHQYLYGKYTYINLAKNGGGLSSSALYNVDFNNTANLILMPLYYRSDLHNEFINLEL